MNSTKMVASEILEIDWRNESKWDVCDKVSESMQENDCYSFTIDDLKSEGFNGDQISEIMQCLHIHSLLVMI